MRISDWSSDVCSSDLVSAQAEGLLPISQHALIFNGRLAYHAYEGVALLDDERGRLQADLGDKSAMILRNHGLLTVGRSVGEAFYLMFMLQRAKSEEHTSELQSLMRISYAVFCLKTKKKQSTKHY